MEKIQANMDILFNPNSIAVIGASNSPDKLGFHVMNSLTKGGYRGEIIPVNPNSEKVMGYNAFKSISDIKKEIDVAIVVLPANRVPDVFRECADKPVKGVVLITAGFKEIDDPVGVALHEEVALLANRAGIPVVGPNTFGMANFQVDLNASFTPEYSFLKKGDISLVSQSGGISALLGYLGMRMDLGFSKIVGLGNRLNVDFAHMIEYLMNDPDTKVIILYIEGIDEPRGLIEVARKYRGKKPIIAFKSGSARIGDQASMSHTGSIAGRHEIYYGSFRQTGILGTDSMESLLDTAKALAACPFPEGPNIAILSGQAGLGMVACDLCDADGLKIVPFNESTQKKINEILPPLALRTNPVDMGPAWYNSAAIKKIVRTVMGDTNINGIIFQMMFASANRDVVLVLTELLSSYRQQKPVISCILSPPGIWDEQVRSLEQSRSLVNYPTPDRAARAMANLRKYGAMQSG